MGTFFLDDRAPTPEERRRRNAALRQQRVAAARAKGRHTKAQWEWLKAACGDRCVRCGSAGPLVRDHIVPVYQGGSDAIENLQPLCDRCNSSKGPEDSDLRPPHVRAALRRL